MNESATTNTAVPMPFDLHKWIEDNQEHLKPPVSNKQLCTEAEDVIVFVSGGPNTRNDYHVNPTEELFYQLKGDIAVRIRPLDGSPPRDVILREGEMWLLPRWVPHRPQRTIGDHRHRHDPQRRHRNRQITRRQRRRLAGGPGHGNQLVPEQDRKSVV